MKLCFFFIIFLFVCYYYYSFLLHMFTARFCVFCFESLRETNTRRTNDDGDDLPHLCLPCSCAVPFLVNCYAFFLLGNFVCVARFDAHFGGRLGCVCLCVV